MRKAISGKPGHTTSNAASGVRTAQKARGTIDEMRRIAEARGGECLSRTYVNGSIRLLWRCVNGHQWKAVPESVKQGTWCPYCAGTMTGTIEEMRRLAEERGGKCLSPAYSRARSRLLWRCAKGHTWRATPNNVKKGSWCPQCSSGLGERVCREFFEQLFRCLFPKSRPKWLLNHKGNQMELDGYSELLGLAFEHHGRQHYSDTLLLSHRKGVKGT